jgi:HSP20 family protein
MTVYRWDVRRDVENAGRRLRKVAQEFDSVMQNGLHIELGTFVPRVDIAEGKDAVYLVAELPGVSQEDVKVTIADGVLTLRGEKKRRDEYTEQNFHRIERSHGEFSRQFTLPDGLDIDNVEANFKDGVLEVRIARAEPEKPREREVKINGGAA